MQSLLILAVPAAALAAMLVRHKWWLTRINSWSMYPTLGPGDCVAARRVGPAERIGRGDIIVIDSAELGRRIVKRVIGLPGETVDVGAREVRVDGTVLDEPYVAVHGGRMGRFHVPPGTYLVLGDNRRQSRDSRSWRTPFVPDAAILARLAIRSFQSTPRERRRQ